jgi:hypothetical protein
MEGGGHCSVSDSHTGSRLLWQALDSGGEVLISVQGLFGCFLGVLAGQASQGRTPSCFPGLQVGDLWLHNRKGMPDCFLGLQEGSRATWLIPRAIGERVGPFGWFVRQWFEGGV